MKERPILFTAEMVKAILDGRKTQTRRVFKLPRWSTGRFFDFELDDDDKSTPMIIARKTGCLATIHCPYGDPGDRLWVKETWAPMCRVADPECGCEDWEREKNHYIEYKADTGNSLPGDWPEEERQDPACPKWKSSRFMTRKASRINLEVVKIRVERVQDISEEDADAEGVGMESYIQAVKYNHYDDGSPLITRAKSLFAGLWDSINAKRGFGWDLNPWVWVVEFKKLECQE